MIENGLLFFKIHFQRGTSSAVSVVVPGGGSDGGGAAAVVQGESSSLDHSLSLSRPSSSGETSL